ncbi:hypothetical protein ACFXC9_07660 [Streptomyces naganishii]|uniref:hypothetical protein n=1 Tax=Streptomyces naganishii TaxID=285447 RepID=UPI0036C0B8D9
MDSKDSQTQDEGLARFKDSKHSKHSKHSSDVQRSYPALEDHHRAAGDPAAAD